MKKVIRVEILVIIIFFVIVFIFKNDFSNIAKVEYQKYNHTNGSFGEVIIIDDNDRIKQITKILNKGKHQKIAYKKDYHENYKLILMYEDGTTEVIRIWKNFGRNFDLFESDKRDGVYKIKNKNSREELSEILN
ncbi:hypothetical protein KHA94_22615 [Bacillus sp. FJAT-49705]|uniref:DUF3139 domain-containing protein n=1 Tax=Cytobacillus citreus TaxID=2833586 RepID=A0ABS5NYK3_9BACI|nr:hypothetical protein [Cytobacillus citreus]MBS4192913.1 hypothetical protein [Cytobacillus citreus]